jgi:tetratricopeptide (TPR) repeat protein
VLGAHDERVLSTIVTLADLYRQSGRPQMGEPLLQKALAARAEAVGRNHASLADALRALADIELALERYGEADAYISRAIALSVKAEKDQLQIAQLFGTRSEIARRQGQLGRAEDFLKRALALHEKARRTDPNSQLGHAFTLLRLAQLYQQSEREQDATVMAERALRICEQALGPDHPVVANQLETVRAAVAPMKATRCASVPSSSRNGLSARTASSSPNHSKGSASLTVCRAGARMPYPFC